MQRMKELLSSVVYWPHIDDNIKKLVRTCTSCAKHQNKPPKLANHPWMLPEKPWSRLHLDHAINFMSTNWLVLVDAYSKYPCTHARQFHFNKGNGGHPGTKSLHILATLHTLVTDNTPTFTLAGFSGMVQETRYYTPQWSSLPSSNKRSCLTSATII